MVKIFFSFLLITIVMNCAIAQDWEIDLINDYHTSSQDYPKKVRRLIRKSQKRYVKQSGLEDIIGENMIVGLGMVKTDINEYKAIRRSNFPLSKYERFLDRIILNTKIAELKKHLENTELGNQLNFYVYPIYSKSFNGITIPYSNDKSKWLIEVNYSDKNVSYLTSILSTIFQINESFENDSWSISLKHVTVENAIDTLIKYPDIQNYFDEFLDYYFLEKRNIPDYSLISQNTSSLAEAFLSTFLDGTNMLLYHECSHAILQHDINIGIKNKREHEADSLAIDIMYSLDHYKNPIELGSIAMALIMINLRDLVTIDNTEWDSERLKLAEQRLKSYDVNLHYFNLISEIFEFLWVNSKHNKLQQKI